MVKDVFLTKQLYEDIVKVATILFPLEVTGVVVGYVKDNSFYGKNIVLPAGIAFEHSIEDIKYYRMSTDFTDFFLHVADTGSRVNTMGAKILKERVDTANTLFQKYKNCWRKRAVIECIRGSPACKDCEFYDIPTLQHNFFREWGDEPEPFLCWHTHPTPIYAPLEEFSIPSEFDLADILQLMQRAREKLIGIGIITVMENHGTSIRIFSPPQLIGFPNGLLWIFNQTLREYIRKVRKELTDIPLNII